MNAHLNPKHPGVAEFGRKAEKCTPKFSFYSPQGGCNEEIGAMVCAPDLLLPVLQPAVPALLFRDALLLTVFTSWEQRRSACYQRPGYATGANNASAWPWYCGSFTWC